MYKEKIYGHLIRIIGSLFWLALIILFLYSPLFLSFNSDDKTLNIFCWSSSFDPDYFTEFEKETGIKLHFSYYETNEELYVKLKALDGGGYDLIVPSDYAVEWLAIDGLLQPLNKEKITFIHQINPALMGHFFDPHNIYSLPFEWGVTGLGIDKDVLKENIEGSWDLVFDPSELPGKISMVNDPKRLFCLQLFIFLEEQKILPVMNLNRLRMY